MNNTLKKEYNIAMTHLQAAAVALSTLSDSVAGWHEVMENMPFTEEGLLETLTEMDDLVFNSCETVDDIIRDMSNLEWAFDEGEYE